MVIPGLCPVQDVLSKNNSPRFLYPLTESVAQVATGFLNQTRSDGGDYKHSKFSQAYVLKPGPGMLFKTM